MLTIEDYQRRGQAHQRATAERPVFLVGLSTYIDLLHQMIQEAKLGGSELRTNAEGIVGVIGPGGYIVYPDPTVEAGEIEVAGGER